MLPLAMLIGSLFSDFFAPLIPMTPYVLFLMLFVTFCRISLADVRFSPMMPWLLAIQILGGIAVYLLIAPADSVVAQGVAVCVFAPTAVSSAVIGAMLGANVAAMASFTLLSNVTVAICAPVLFSFVGSQVDMPFWESFVVIISRVGPLLILPMVIAFALKKIAPRIHQFFHDHQIISFYMWAFALIVVTARTVKFILEQENSGYRTEILIGVGSLIACLAQFAIGRRIGQKFGESIAGGQALGQKNTLLTIWMAQSYLHPMASIGPASYVLWQNLVNSWQLWRRRGV